MGRLRACLLLIYPVNFCGRFLFTDFQDFEDTGQRMNSRERVITTLEHKEPDRIPFDLGSTFVTGITKGAYVNLASALGEDAGQVELCDTLQQLAVVKENILEKLGIDIRGLIPNIVRKNPPLEQHGDCRIFIDEWAVSWRMPKGSLYFDMLKSPLAGNISEKDIDNVPWPDPSDAAIWERLEEKGRQYYDQGYAVILENLCAGIFEMSCRVRGTEQFLMDLAMNPSLACRLMDKFVELKLEFYEAASKRLGRYVQFVREGDDIAGQESLLISPQMYRELIKPRHKRLFQAQRKLFPAPFYIFFHSDGAIYDIVPDFIEVGVEVLNPVQLTAKGMEARRLKEQYGKDLSFWGGGVDTQNVLPNGGPEEVKANVKERIEQFSPGGGFVFGAVHNIQDDVPAKNILSMIEQFRELRAY